MSASSEPRKPRQIRRVVLPDVTGLHVDDARVVLLASGFELVKVNYEEDYLEDFHVIDMKPGSGILVDRHAEIALSVSRTSLVQYLPKIYQQSATEGSYLRGFLYIIQTMSDGIGGRINDLHRLFDPRTTDEEFLPWLASWLAISLNSEWTELQTRQMLLAATRLFPYRGTAHCIKEFVRIYSGCEVEISENDWPFKGFRIGVHSTVGIDTVILPAMNLSHCFVVKLDRAAEHVSEEEIIRIHRIIQSQKPAHTSYFLSFADERATGDMGAFMQIGVGAALGVGEAAPDSDAGMAMGMGIGMEEAEIVREDVAPVEDEKPVAKGRTATKAQAKGKDVDAASAVAADKKKATGGKKPAASKGKSKSRGLGKSKSAKKKSDE